MHFCIMKILLRLTMHIYPMNLHSHLLQSVHCSSTSIFEHIFILRHFVPRKQMFADFQITKDNIDQFQLFRRSLRCSYHSPLFSLVWVAIPIQLCTFISIIISSFHYYLVDCKRLAIVCRSIDKCPNNCFDCIFLGMALINLFIYLLSFYFFILSHLVSFTEYIFASSYFNNLQQLNSISNLK